MDKLKMAHDYLLKIMSNSPLVDQVDIEFAVSTAWSYARMMHSEKIKEDKTDSEQKRKEIREMLNDANTFIEREGQHFDDVEEWKPDWSQAPTGCLYWMVLDSGACIWMDGLYNRISDAPSFNYKGNWQVSLRKRPNDL